MPDPSGMFSAATEKRPFPWKRLWLIISAAVVVVVVIGAIVIVQKKGPKYREGRTIHAGVLRQGEPGFPDYLPYLRIVNAGGMVSENLLGGQQAVVAGTLINQGNRLVEVVEIRASLYDAEDRLMQQFVKTPIQPDFPLQPMEMRKFSLWVEPFPPQWLTGRIEVELHGYRVRR
ncbi:MAG TPA: FxLYD domain-containing protein [Acidobacteriota bacterium]|nr:FxLYD domain-containing protein [Acidobacteriota bacterium]HQM62331.1 FxLYD domain-containing protein [Acidobacteriota bacterium]